MTGHGWTIEEACEQFREAGMPVDPKRFRKLIQVLQPDPIAETRPGEKGGRGQFRYEIGELQQIHRDNVRWLTRTRNPRRRVPRL